MQLIDVSVPINDVTQYDIWCAWLEENVGSRSVKWDIVADAFTDSLYTRFYIQFVNNEDAAAFKLRFPL